VGAGDKQDASRGGQGTKSPGGTGPGSPPSDDASSAAPRADGNDSSGSDGNGSLRGSGDSGQESRAPGTKDGPGSNRSRSHEAKRSGDRAQDERGGKRDQRDRDAKAEPTAGVAADDETDDDVVVTGDLPEEPASDSGSPVATVTGIGLLALLGAGAGVSAWRRRRT
jgi:hypothetical protein